MKDLLSLTFIVVVFAVGDYISAKTKSIVSMLFTCSVIFLVGFWLGVPTDIFESSHLLNIGALLIMLLLTHMGTLLNLQQLKEQWKTVVVAVTGIIGIAVFLFLVGDFFIGRETAIIAAPPISGGVIAGIKMGQAAEKIGREDLQIMATLIVVVQGFLGYPIASIALKKVAKKVVEDRQMVTTTEEVVEKEKKKLLPPLPEHLRTANVYLAKTAIVASLAAAFSMYLNKLVGFQLLDQYIAALLFGVIFSEIGFLEKEVLIKANSFGFGMAALLVVIFSSLTKATPEVVLELLPKMGTALILGVIGIAIASLITSKVLKMPFLMALAIGVSALFGFPGTFVVSNEVALAVATNEVERKAILDAILPKMLVAGFITVSIGSVVLAGIMANLL
ncbi:MAG: hypothetical protein Q4P28_03090 [Tissierellia bacterium]|nr:hypothetical protein [Tissierellia bacterium]